MTPDELIQLKRDLDEASEKLNQEIIQFKEDLKKLSLGVQAWTNASENVRIGYCKWQGNWDVFINYDEFGEDKCQPIDKCTRQLRLHAYKHRDKLVEALEEAAKSLLVRINKALNNEPSTEPEVR